MRRFTKKMLALIGAGILTAGCITGCGDRTETATATPLPSDQAVTTEAADTVQAETESEPAVADTATDTETDVTDVISTDWTPAEPNGDIYILCTSDVHCGVDQGFGYAGLYEIRKTLQSQGYTTILVDDGDNIQGEALGTLTKGQISMDLMNAIGYDIAVPGNHEFDYGMDRFLELADQAQFTYISCNFNKEGELVFEPYKIVEACGKKIAFVGITTPETLTSSTPSNFQNDAGEYVYGFCQDEDGQGVYDAVQEAVDAARAEGADYVYVMAHMGLEDTAKPWRYTDVVSHTTGIDVFLDGHSHDTEQVVMKNAEGKDVARCAVGTKMSCVGYSLITDAGIEKTNIWSWPNSIDAPTMLNIQNPMRDLVDDKLAELDEILAEPIANSDVDLLINDPVEKDASGNPIRMARRGETNLGDLVTDAFRSYTGADIALMNGGGLRASIDKGEITFGDVLAVFPWSNSVCVIEATGQQILDALEWASRGVPDENGAFLQVSGLTYVIDSTIPDPCVADADSMMSGINGPRRVKDVMVGDEPIDPQATYTVAGLTYGTLKHGDGMTAFDGATVISSEICVDNEALSEYIKGELGGSVGEEYADPYGQGRIEILE